MNLRAMDLSDDLITLGHGRSANGLFLRERLDPHEALITLTEEDRTWCNRLVKGKEKDVPRSTTGCRCRPVVLVIYHVCIKGPEL